MINTKLTLVLRKMKGKAELSSLSKLMSSLRESFLVSPLAVVGSGGVAFAAIFLDSCRQTPALGGALGPDNDLVTAIAMVGCSLASFYLESYMQSIPNYEAMSLVEKDFLPGPHRSYQVPVTQRHQSCH